jgi:hypothetical protein
LDRGEGGAFSWHGWRHLGRRLLVWHAPGHPRRLLKQRAGAPAVRPTGIPTGIAVAIGADVVVVVGNGHLLVPAPVPLVPPVTFVPLMVPCAVRDVQRGLRAVPHLVCLLGDAREDVILLPWCDSVRVGGLL